MNTNTRADARAFTLLELLAVVAIAGLLVATRFAAFSHTRNRSQDVIDFLNNKQLMAAANMYGADQNDVLPGCAWGTANDSWAYARNIGGSYANQLTFLRRGQLFRYVKSEKTFMCPIDVPDRLFFVRGLLVTSYTWNGAVGGYGSLTTPNGLGSYKVAQFKPDAILQWEADGSTPFYFNDASAFPDEGASHRHGNGATVGLISGGIQRISYKLWFSSSYAGSLGARGAKIPTARLPNQFWCNPGVRRGLPN